MVLRERPVERVVAISPDTSWLEPAHVTSLIVIGAAIIPLNESTTPGSVALACAGVYANAMSRKKSCVKSKLDMSSAVPPKYTGKLIASPK